MESAVVLSLQEQLRGYQEAVHKQEKSKKHFVRNLDGLIHKIVRISRKDYGLPIAVLGRRIGKTEWDYKDVPYNDYVDGEYPTLVGIVIAYEITDDPQVQLIVVAPGDPREYGFDLQLCEFEVLESFLAAE